MRLKPLLKYIFNFQFLNVQRRLKNHFQENFMQMVDIYIYALLNVYLFCMKLSSGKIIMPVVLIAKHVLYTNNVANQDWEIHSLFWFSLTSSVKRPLFSQSRSQISIENSPLSQRNHGHACQIQVYVICTRRDLSKKFRPLENKYIKGHSPCCQWQLKPSRKTRVWLFILHICSSIPE